MIDKTPHEQRALESTLRTLGEVAAEIGFSKPLVQYTQTEALQLIEGVVTAYQDHLLDNALLDPLESLFSTEGVPFDV